MLLIILILFLLLLLNINNHRLFTYIFRNNKNSYMTNSKYICWKYKEIIISNTNMEMYYFNFLNNTIRITLTNTANKDGLYFVSFIILKNNNALKIFSNNIKNNVFSFDNHTDAINFFFSFKKDISKKLNNDIVFKENSKINPVIILA